MMKIKRNIEEIKADIKKYSTFPENVVLVAVTKYVDIEMMDNILKNGVMVFGENKAQLMREKFEHFKNLGKNGIKWHFIGNLQKNKVKYIIDFVDLIHSLNKLSLANEIDKRASQIGKIQDVLLEVNLFEEESKEGYLLAELYKDLSKLLELKNINIVGLMGMAPFTDNVELIREGFRKLKILKDDLNKKYFNGKLKELSMGMSNDYKIALEEGATIIRIGTKIYS